MLGSTTVFNFDNKCISWAANQIIMISEDHVTEDWSNDAENTALIS